MARLTSVLRVILLVFASFSCLSSGGCQLTANYYEKTCPKVEAIVNSTFTEILAKNDTKIAPPVLRLIFHDCFVQGCDASVLIESTPGNKAEKDSEDIPQVAFNAVNMIKQEVEKACPGVVSCADILALASRDAVVILGGPSWKVPLGRRDGLVSKADMVAKNIPKSNISVPELLSSFQSKGLDLHDLVVLSGAHTVGFSFCDQFDFRYMNPESLDASLDPTYAQQIKGQCVTKKTIVPLDPPSPLMFDISYFTNLQNHKGLLHTDEVLFTHNSTRGMVDSFASSQSKFFESFPKSMIKMTSIGVLTGKEGEIRRSCGAVNAA